MALFQKAIRAFMIATTALLTTEAFEFSTRPAHAHAKRGNVNGNRQLLSQRLHMSIPNSLDVLTSGLVSIFRLPNGVTVSSPGAQIENSNTKITKLYDIENSKSCRAVRERITELDLVVERVIPVAAGSQNAASMLRGKQNAPVLVASLTTVTTPSKSDSESDGEELESKTEESTLTIEGTDAILSFLDESFTDRSSPSNSIQEGTEDDVVAIAKEKLQLAGMYLASWMRSGRGESVSPSVSASSNSKRPEQPLILYSYEGNQFCRLVREVLTELDIVYELRSAGKESPRRSELASIAGGSSQCPYLVDPNTGISMAESADIVGYLYKTYASWTPPSELLEWASSNVMSLAKPLFKVLTPLQAGENDAEINYKGKIRDTMAVIEAEAAASPVVVYTYELSPFSTETKLLLDRLDVEYKEVSLGKEWLPGLIAENGAITRAALLEMTGQSSLPQVFIDGKPIGGLFSGSPGLLPMLKNGEFPKGSPVATPDSSGNGMLDANDAFQ